MKRFKSGLTTDQIMERLIDKASKVEVQERPTKKRNSRLIYNQATLLAKLSVQDALMSLSRAGRYSTGRVEIVLTNLHDPFTKWMIDKGHAAKNSVTTAIVLHPYRYAGNNLGVHNRACDAYIETLAKYGVEARAKRYVSKTED